MLYLIKHSRPEIANCVRELSKTMQRPTEEHNNELMRIIKWVLNTPNFGLKIKPEVKRDKNGRIIWELRGICDATWGSDKADGKSVTGYILYFMGVPIAWRSKKQKVVALSSTEAEYNALADMVKEVLYVKQLLEEVDIEVDTPIKIFIDNVGAIHMARNNLGHSETRHMNIKLHFVRELHGDVIELCFVKSAENEADIMTKNATRAEHDRHSTKLISEVPEALRLSS